MERRSDILTQITSNTFLTDGGLETTLIFHQGIELTYFASFSLLNDEAGKKALADYFRPYLNIAQKYQTGFILDSATWRANPDWAEKMGYSTEALEQINKIAIDEVAKLRDEYARPGFPILLNGCIGPRGDGYVPSNQMTAQEAETYHSEQIKTFSQTQADMVSGLTMNYVEEAIGITLAAKQYGMPVVISFTVETNGILPSGQSLQDAIIQTDQATDRYVAYYMINCAHPTHFMKELQTEGNWLNRIKGIRANASTKSHKELDESTELDSGDKQLLARNYQQLKTLIPNLTIIGGCCGTDHTHLETICEHLFNKKLNSVR
ncbi:homocysteine S-methyltransferase [Rhodocytophaga rosea]|uniref:Homocysteine S-methyltransferase n=1 Tax=Rhodocytophaga rosea TaxID=2704465 RepID=A0A6C0GRY3_9BACT|nr:homocysteine S-methyltransferase family protein [Rhodocytophaga rosea]QHT70697.1 homocysteine S-methyltransferase [Rhodocytophaga rosea]